MDWHDEKCRLPDLARVDGLVSCLSCGSFQDTGESQSPTRVDDSDFYYPPIRQRTELRLLLVYPGKLEDPVQCRLVIGNVADAEFEAISYTWSDESGDKSKSKSLIIESTPFPVTRNCEMALSELEENSPKDAYGSTRCA